MYRKTKYSTASIEELLAELDPAEVLSDLGINSDSIEHNKEGFVAPCPAHSNGTDQTLVYDADQKTTYCREFKCRASKVTGGAGNLIWLYALVRGTPYDEALESWASRVNVRLAAAQIDVVREKNIDDFKYVEIARFSRSIEDNTLIPSQFGFEDQESKSGRGVVIDIGDIKEFVDRYKVDLCQTRFLFENDTIDSIRTAAAANELYMLGNYYILFEAKSSAEIVHAINQAIELMEFLRLTYDIPLDAIHVPYSGKRIEIEIDYTVFGITPKNGLHNYFKKMTELLVEMAANENGNGVEQFNQIDYSAYNPFSMTHIPGSAIAEGKGIHKIRIPYNLFKKTNYVRLYEMSQTRPPFSIPKATAPVSERAAELFNQISSEIEGRLEEEGDIVATTFYLKREPEKYDSISAFSGQLLNRYFSEKRRVIPTPSEHLNSILGGGFQPGSLTIIAGFPGSGTTSFCLWCANHMAKEHNVHSVYITLQQGIEEIYAKSLSQIGEIPSRDLIKRRNEPGSLSSDDQFNKSLTSAFESYQKFNHNVTVIEGSASMDEEFLHTTLVELRKRYRARGESRSIFVVLDSIQLLLANINASQPDRQIDMNILTSRIKSLARELDISILATNEYLLDYQHFYPKSDISNKVILRFYHETQFADSVCFLVSQNKSLSNIINYFETNYTEKSLKAEVEQIVARLKELEKELQKHPRTQQFAGIFSVLEVIKNRGGKRGKVLFVHERAISNFIPLTYKDTEVDSEVI